MKIFFFFSYDDNKEKELAIELKKKIQLDSSMLAASVFVDNYTVEESMNNLTPIEEEQMIIGDVKDVEAKNNDDAAKVNNDDREIEEKEEEEKSSEMENVEENDENEEEEEEDEEEEKENSLKDTSGESLPPKVENWIPAAHLQEDEFFAKITYVGYDCEVYFHPDTEECT